MAFSSRLASTRNLYYHSRTPTLHHRWSRLPKFGMRGQHFDGLSLSQSRGLVLRALFLVLFLTLDLVCNLIRRSHHTSTRLLCVFSRFYRKFFEGGQVQARPPQPSILYTLRCFYGQVWKLLRFPSSLGAVKLAFHLWGSGQTQCEGGLSWARRFCCQACASLGKQYRSLPPPANSKFQMFSNNGQFPRMTKPPRVDRLLHSHRYLY